MNRRRLYDYQLGAKRADAGSRPFAQQSKCPACGKGFTHLKPAGTGKKGWRSVAIVVHTVEVSDMRGDDKCYAYHPECWEAAHPLPAMPSSHRRPNGQTHS